MAAARRQREWAPADVPAIPRKVHVGARVDQHSEDRRSAPATDRVVQAAVRVDVDTAAEKPPQAGDVLEVELVVYAARVSGCVERSRSSLSEYSQAW